MGEGKESIMNALFVQDVANQFNNYLLLGYFVMWLMGVIYVSTLFVRQRNLKADIRLMQQILQDDE